MNINLPERTKVLSGGKTRSPISTRRAICRGGGRPGQHRERKQPRQHEVLPQPYSCVKSSRSSVLAGFGSQTRLSRYPDLRIVSCRTAFSGLRPCFISPNRLDGPAFFRPDDGALTMAYFVYAEEKRRCMTEKGGCRRRVERCETGSMPNDRFSPCAEASTLTVAVPFGSFTRFPIVCQSPDGFGALSGSYLLSPVTISYFPGVVNENPE